MTLKREIKDAYLEGGNSIYVKTHSNAVYVDDNETETLTQRLNDIKSSIDNNPQSNAIVHKSPENFGAKGDGVTDDTKAIQDAVNSGYAIDFKLESIYLIKNKINIPSGTVINGNNSTIKWYNTDIVLNDMSVRAHWTGVFNIQGAETTTKTQITNYHTKREPIECGAFTVNSVDGFDINDYIKINIEGGYTKVNSYDDYKPSVMTIAKITDIDVASKIIYTDLFIPFDMTSTVFDSNTTITKLNVINNVLIENIIIEDITPGENHTNNDGANKDKLACGISTNMASNVIIRNVKGRNMKNPLVMFHYCHNYTAENIENIDPAYTGPAEGYCVKCNRSTVGNISNIYGKGCRHLVDLSWSSFTTIEKCNDTMPYDKRFGYSLDLHGVCEHNITFRDCKGSFIFGNGIGSFPNLSAFVTVDNCKGDFLLGNVQDLKILNSNLILRSYSPDSARVISVDINDSKIELGKGFNALGTKRGIGLETRFTMNNCNITSYKGYTPESFVQNIIKNIDVVVIENSFIDLSDTRQGLRVEEALSLEFNNNNVIGTCVDFLREATTDVKNINYECDNNIFYVKEGHKFVENASRNLIKLKNIKYSTGIVSVSNNKINANGSVAFPLNIIDVRDSDGYFDNSHLTVIFSNNVIVNDSNCSNISFNFTSDRIKFISDSNSVKSDLLYYDQLLKYSTVIFVDGNPILNNVKVIDKISLNDNAQILSNPDMVSVRKMANGSYEKELLTIFLKTDVTQVNTDTFRLKTVDTLPKPRKGGIVFYADKYYKCSDGTSWVEF